MAGRIDLFVSHATSPVTFNRGRRIKAHAMTRPECVPGLDPPTTAEAKQSGISVNTWHGIDAPAGTPPEIDERLRAAVRAALKAERLRVRFAEVATVPATDERATLDFHRASLPGRWRAGGRSCRRRRIRGSRRSPKRKTPGSR
jgi:tripartite-type tricarboxylate transporter receptor subunit TctC